jgi:hypothetical protein
MTEDDDGLPQRGVGEGYRRFLSYLANLIDNESCDPYLSIP